jgi:chromosome segregation ATPase
VQAAQHFWEVAQVTARVDLEAPVQERLAPMQAELERAEHLAAIASAETESASTKAIEARNQLTDVTARLETERAAHAATGARIEAAQRQIEDLKARLNAAETQAQAAAERARAEIQSAHERATGAERRAALEIENERSARGKAERRAEGLEKRVERLQALSASQVEELVKARAELDHERASSQHLRATNQAASAERQAVDAALIEAKVTIGRAEAEAKATKAAMTQLLPLLAEGRPKKAVAKPRLASRDV